MQYENSNDMNFSGGKAFEGADLFVILEHTNIGPHSRPVCTVNMTVWNTNLGFINNNTLQTDFSSQEQILKKKQVIIRFA